LVGDAVGSTAVADVPSDYDELARRYLADIRAVVRRRIPWAQPCDVDDVVQDILRRFQVTDVIGQYNPEFVSGRSHKTVPFRSFILAKVPLYCRGKAERLATVWHREPLIANAPAGDGSSTWIEAVAEAPVDLAGLDDGAALARLRAALADRPALPGSPGPLALFDELAERVAAGKPVTGKVLARRYRTEPEMADSWLAQLRDELRAAAAGDYRSARGGAREFGGVWLSGSQLREAARLLREAPGNQVVRVWERGGHPLARAGRIWYLRPAKAELAAYPQLRGDRGGHYEGGHGSPVKRGLIHWLERQAGEMDQPAPPDPAWAVLETALGALPGATGELVADAMAVVAAMFGEGALWTCGC
jgi:hypothetical protein